MKFGKEFEKHRLGVGASRNNDCRLTSGAIMNEEVSEEGLTLIKHCEGYFGDNHVDGKWFQGQGGEMSWLVKLVSSHKWGSYWVTGDEFRSAVMNAGLPNKASIGISSAVASPDPGVKQVLLDAIRKWEGEATGS